MKNREIISSLCWRVQNMNTLAPPEDSRGDYRLQPRSPHLHRRKLSANVEIQSQGKKSRIPEWPEEVRYNL